MPDLNHRFSSGKMNKDLDERLVPNGEYRDALNIEVATSEGSDLGTVQTLKGNINASLEILDPRRIQNFYCVGSIVDEKNDKIYWLISGVSKDIIAEYDYKTKVTTPVVVDVFTAGTLPGNESGRVLNFDRSLYITGINIIENLLFWTDNYTEPKRIHIERCKLGSVDFNTQTQFYVRDAADINPENKFIPIGPIKHEHITVIKKGPPAAPVLEMRNTLRAETEENTVLGSYLPEYFLKLYGTFDADETVDPNPFVDGNGDLQSGLITIDFQPLVSTIGNSYPDFHIGDIIRIYVGVDEPEGDKYIRAKIIDGINHDTGWAGSCKIKILSGDKTIAANDDATWYIVLEEGETMFKFNFPRFATRYKYEDGEYSAFSPFSEVAFLPTDFDYQHKEGYNLGMVNNIRFLAIKDFVHGRQIPDDVISIDILYKESNSPNVYTVKTIKRLTGDWKENWAPWQTVNPEDAIQKYSEWNAVGPNQGVLNNSGVNNISPNQRTRGWTRITNEMIHAVLPANQLLRPWDNVPRVALAQEVTGNRIVYANYLQNYNLFNSKNTIASALTGSTKHNYGELNASKDIDVDVNIGLDSKKIASTAILPEQKNAYLHYANSSNYRPSKSIKTLRTYQLGVVYIDEFGRETPVFSDKKTGESSLYIEKDVANKANKLTGQIFNIVPEWARYFKFFIKETSGEYYNLAMDRWYNAEDGNIWLSFASSERNKVDEQTFLILKKAHDSDRAIFEQSPNQENYQGFVKNKARYKIIAISNEAPTFVKTFRINKPTFDDSSGAFIATASGVGFPKKDVNNFYIDKVQADLSGWGGILGVAENVEAVDVSKFEFRFKGVNGVSNWYKIKSVSLISIGTGFYNVVADKLFEADVHVLSNGNTYASYGGGAEIELGENIVENKPEFDGRFFVKIKKDQNLIENIIQESSQSKTYVVSQALQSQYINPQSGATVGGFALGTQAKLETWYGALDTNPLGHPKTELLSISENNDKGYFSHGNSGNGEAYWQKAARSESKATEDNADSNGWFIDKVEAFRPFKYTEYFFDKDDNYSVNDRHHPSHNSPFHGFFSYSSSEHGQHMYLDEYEHTSLQVLGTNTWNTNSGVHWPYGGGINYTSNIGYLNQKEIAPPEFETETFPNNSGVFVSELRNAPGGQNGRIVPSVGIDTSDNIIHLSFAGIGDDGTPGDMDVELLSELKLDFSDYSTFNQYVSDQLFINSLCTPGTIWRWEEDPDKTLYITKIPDYDTITQTQSEWNYNTRDNINFGVYYGVALYNYVTFQDYLTTHKHDPGASGYDPHTHWAFASQGFQDYDGDNGPRVVESPPLSGNYIVESVGLSAATAGLPGISTLTPAGIGTPAATVDDDLNNFGRYELRFGESGYCPTGVENGGPNTNRFGRTAGPWTMNTSKTNTGGTNILLKNPHYYHPQRVKEFWKGIAKRRRYQIHAMTYEEDGSPAQGLGIKGASKYLPTNPTNLTAHWADDGSGVLTVSDPLPATPAPGIRSDGMYSGAFEDPADTSGTSGANATEIPFYKTNVTESAAKTVDGAPGSCTWQILEKYSEFYEVDYSSSNPAIWETEPKETVDLDIYHEVGQIYPTELNDATNEQFVGPVHPRTFEYYNSSVKCIDGGSGVSKLLGTDGGVIGSGLPGGTDIRVRQVEDNVLYLCDVQGNDLNSSAPNPIFPSIGDILVFVRADGSSTQTSITDVDTTTGAIILARDVHNYEITLPWFNCYAFGNGVESDRVRDDFNQVTIDNGPKVSATLEEPYEEERRGSGLIYSGIYNSMSGVNNLNQFIQAEKITKDLNPIHGTIQKLYSRNTDLLTFCEDKVFKILANKDALFNADGNSNVTATANVLGQTIPFLGEFGISKNPESFVAESYRNYFTDKVKGTVIRLSRDGMTPISDYGMQDYFGDNLKHASRLIGTFDEKKQEYNLTLDHKDYPKPTPPIVMATGIVEIEAEIGMAPSGPISVSFYEPTGRLIAATSLPVFLGQLIEGPGLQPNTIVTGTSIEYGQLYIDISPTPELQEVSPLLGPSEVGAWAGWYTPVTISQPAKYGDALGNTTNALDRTVSFSERSKGWVSFKSFIPEGGLSLNNTYYTFKEGILWEHHANETRNNFYEDQYDSSVQVLFNDAPSIVKSFQTLNYEGSKSRVTPDITSDGQYWDNYEKAGWYVDNMVTDLQEAGQQEFKSKENKWFSQIKGVATEWLDDGTAGNIDTREQSYQGIDNNHVKAVVEGDYTSWDCDGTDCIELQGKNAGPYATKAICEADLTNNCGDVGTSWACDATIGCHEVTGLSGGYSSWCECIQTSTCCARFNEVVVGLDGVGIVSNSATQYYTDNCDATAIFGCMDLDGTEFNNNGVSVPANRPVGWVGQASNYNILANVHTCDCEYNIAPTSYNCMPDGSGGFSCVDPGNGSGYYSTLNACLNDPNSNCLVVPCSQTNPHQIVYSKTDATENTSTRCNPTNDDGTILVAINALGSLSAWIYITIFTDDGSGNLGTLVAGNSTTQYDATSGTFNYNNLIAGNYHIKMEDDQGCVHTIPFTIDCAVPPASCSANAFDVNVTVIKNLVSIDQDCEAVGPTGTGEIQVTCTLNGYGLASGNYQADLYDDPPATYLGGAQLLQTQTGSLGTTFTFTAIIPTPGQYNYQNPPYDYKVVFTDDFGCIREEKFSLSCQTPLIPVTYDCVPNTGSGGGGICVDPGTGNGAYLTLTACMNDVTNNVAPCNFLPSSPCPNSDYLSDSDFSGISNANYSPSLLHAWGGNYRCNNTFTTMSCVNATVNEFFGLEFPQYTPTLTAGSYDISPYIPNVNNAMDPALIYNPAIPNQWSVYSSDRGSLPFGVGSPYQDPSPFTQTPLTNAPTIDSNGHLRLNGFIGDTEKSTYLGTNTLANAKVMQGLYMQVENIVAGQLYQCVIKLGTDWDQGNYGYANNSLTSPGTVYYGEGWSTSGQAGEMVIGTDGSGSSGIITANNGTQYAALNLGIPQNAPLLNTIYGNGSDYMGILQTENYALNAWNYGTFEPGGTVGFIFEKHPFASPSMKDLLVISVVSNDVQYLSIEQVCISPYSP